MLTIVMYKKMIHKEICPVKKLKDGGHQWVQTFHHATDLLWREKALNKVKGIGEAKQMQMAEKGFTTVKHIKYATINQLNLIACDWTNTFTLTSLHQLQ